MTNTLRIKRRAAGGAPGAPTSLENAELAYNEQDNVLYYGTGTGGAGGTATQVLAIGGSGAFAPIAHIGSGAGAHADVVAAGASGFITGADKTKLNSIATSANNYVHPNHTGDVTSTGDGATVIGTNKVTNAMLSTIGTATIKGRITAATGNVEDLTAANVRTIINVADGANNYIHPTGDGNLHVPATSTTNNGNVLTAGSTAGSLSWSTPLALSNVAPAALATSATQGVATSAARSDHVHALPTLNSISAPTAAVALNAQKITGLAEPTSAQDAATKNYVDSLVQGLTPKASVRAATTVAGTLASSFTNGSVIDGITLVTGNRILIKDQATPAENGIYTVNASGAPTRSLDANSWAELPSAYVFVEEGTVNLDIGYLCTSNQGGTLGTTAVSFVQFTGAGQIVDGVGLTKSGNTINLDTASAGALGGIRVGSGLTIDGSGILASVAGNGAPLIITTNTTALSPNSYVINAPLTLTLPLNPPVGSVIMFQNTSGATSTIARNGQPIMGLAEDLILDLTYSSAKLVYTDATQGWLATEINATQVVSGNWNTITNKPTTVAGYGITDAVGVTNLGIGTRTTTTVPITSSTGISATFPEATTSLAGALNSTDKTKLNNLATTYLSFTSSIDGGTF